MIRAVIHTAALRHNLARVREAAPNSRVLAVIKANAYGHGLVPVAQALAAAGVEAFGVARLEEGLALRAAGLATRVVLLEGVFDADQLQQAAHSRLDLVVHDPAQLALLESQDAGYPFPVWLKIDTGMGRLGFQPEAAPAALARLQQCRSVQQPVRLMSHFADAEHPDSPQTRSQLVSFDRAVAGLAGERSLANSAAVLSLPSSHYDWVRPGLMLYGVSPLPGVTASSLGLKPVMTLETRVIALKDLAEGDRVGYGGHWQAARPSRIAVAAAGYGDGYPRNTASGTPVLVAGRRAALAGCVSMDMISIDVTGLPEVRVGDRVQLWGPAISVAQVAQAAGTIPYELLCRVSQRVQLEIT